MVVVHCRTDEDSPERLVGLVVPQSAIPLATRRNRVKRRLRHLIRSRLAAMPEGTRIVIRAQAQASGADPAALERSLDRAMTKACGGFQ